MSARGGETKVTMLRYAMLALATTMAFVIVSQICIFLWRWWAGGVRVVLTLTLALLLCS